jgi:cyanophycinase-like exopeptidase
MRQLLFLSMLLPFVLIGQNYTSFKIGNTTDVMTNPSGGVCLMGGATEDDNAMKWFLENANGGDVLVLRTSGGSGYNSYFYEDLGVQLNSVETIVCHNESASHEAYLIQKIQQAEAIWFAGGDQWTYISYWRNSPVASAINDAITNRNIVIGGTSAGMAIQGSYYFSAQNGTVTSTAALNNPFNSQMSVQDLPFIQNEYLNGVITDTHFDNPDRKGRVTTFLARMNTDFGIFGKAIACDEYTAVCIDHQGIAKVFGGFPNYDDNAYFIQTNCEIENPIPEVCIPSNPLTWQLDGAAIKVYQIKGTANGAHSFDLNDWQMGVGGTWKNWSVNQGVFSETDGLPLDCEVFSNTEFHQAKVFVIAPNPTHDLMTINTPFQINAEIVFKLQNQMGQIIPLNVDKINDFQYQVNVSHLNHGLYILTIIENGKEVQNSKIVKY